MMNLRKLLPFAVVLTLVACGVKLCDTLLNLHGSGFFLSGTVCNGIVAASFILLYVIGFVLSITDRKKNFSAEPVKSFLVGGFGFLAAVLLIGSGVIRLMSSGEHIAENLLAAAAGFVLLYESSISLTGNNGMKKIPVVALLLPIWCCARFVRTFSEYTQVSLQATELFDMVELAFLMLFLFYQAMFFAGLNNKVAVRRSVVYGTVFILLGLTVSADLLIKMFYHVEKTNVDTQIVEAGINNILLCCCDLALCGYAFFFMRSMLKQAQKHLKQEDDENDNPDDVLLPPDDSTAEAVPEQPAPDDAELEALLGTAEAAQMPEKDGTEEIFAADAEKPLEEAPAVEVPDAAEAVEENFDHEEPALTQAAAEESADTSADVQKKPLTGEEELPRVSEPMHPEDNSANGAYDELFEMLDAIQ